MPPGVSGQSYAPEHLDIHVYEAKGRKGGGGEGEKRCRDGHTSSGQRQIGGIPRRIPRGSGKSWGNRGFRPPSAHSLTLSLSLSLSVYHSLRIFLPNPPPPPPPSSFYGGGSPALHAVTFLPQIHILSGAGTKKKKKGTERGWCLGDFKPVQHRARPRNGINPPDGEKKRLPSPPMEKGAAPPDESDRTEL
ncbi:hypothetical protein LZ30DRAFT_34971 [Colletotrichum cereale]|nr:hypothetical protein LZ30DRAFT_34971 [Colletotrichum cereale]